MIKFPTSMRERILMWFFPRRCIWCMGVTAPDHMFCTDCESVGIKHKMEPSKLAGTQIPLIAVMEYHSKAKEILHKLKFHGKKEHKTDIGFAMADALSAAQLLDNPSEWIFCAVPMTETKIKKRGYNQSELLARSASRWIDAEHLPGLLKKVRETGVQHDLKAADRAVNVSGAFAVDKANVINRKIVLVDDTYTTGATLRECARVLEEAGAERIICLTYLLTTAKWENSEKKMNQDIRKNTAGFTGPRPHRFPFNENEDHPLCLAIKAALRREIVSLCDKGVTRYLTGAAAGVDMWCGEIVLELIAEGKNIELIAVVPFRAQDEKWSAKNKERYAAILDVCSSVLVLSEDFHKNCYLERNTYLVEQAEYIIAMPDYSNQPRSGTRQTINLALKNGNTLIYASAKDEKAP